MTFINLTPHALNIHRTDGTVLTLMPDGRVARVGTTRVPGLSIEGIETFHVIPGGLTGLPPAGHPANSVAYIVSGMVAVRCVGREDVFSPGALVRDESGRPIGCLGLTRIPQ